MEPKHIIITGDRGSGKTTLLKEISDELKLSSPVPGVVTWVNPGKCVFMKELGKENAVIVGEFDPCSTSMENRMKPVPMGFDVQGVYILENLINSDSEWVTIDEIGYLEGTSSLFLNKLDQLFNQKRVIAVVRKQNTSHINKILERDDAFVIDLDCLN